MKGRFYHFVFIFSLIITVCLLPEYLRAKTNPILNDGKKWRIGYYEGGPYTDYVTTMQTLIMGLIKLGWIQDSHITAIEGEIPKPYWEWLTRAHSKYLSFRPQDGYSANWEDSKRARHKSEIMSKLINKRLDLIIAMGSWAGQDLANNQHAIPTVVLSTSDPIKAGIIKSAEDSGYDHVTARVDRDRYLRQVRMFHRIARFKRLGVVYEDTPLGRVYSALDEVQRAATERGFELVTCGALDNNTDDINEANQSCLECYRRLTTQADAIYVTALNCVDRLMNPLSELFITNRIPSFSMPGSKLVEKGLMISISSDSGYESQGIYNASKIAAILNGAKPRSLSQKLSDPLDIAVNVDTVRRIGFKMPPSIFKIAHEIYGK
jgi:ABC-type uncharacterized transport system substrate-binding protein